MTRFRDWPFRGETVRPLHSPCGSRPASDMLLYAHILIREGDRISAKFTYIGNAMQ